MQRTVARCLQKIKKIGHTCWSADVSVSVFIGRFSFECPKTKTKVITMAKLKEGKHYKEPMRTQSKMNCSKRGKTRVTKLRFLFGPAFDWLKEWASFCLNRKP